MTDKQQEIDVPALKVEDTDAADGEGTGGPADAPPKAKEKKKPPMSQISGVRKLRHTNSFTGIVPKFGVAPTNDEELTLVSVRAK